MKNHRMDNFHNGFSCASNYLLSKTTTISHVKSQFLLTSIFIPPSSHRCNARRIQGMELLLWNSLLAKQLYEFKEKLSEFYNAGMRHLLNFHVYDPKASKKKRKRTKMGTKLCINTSDYW